MQLPILSNAGVQSTLLEDLPVPTEQDWRTLRPLPMSAEEAAERGVSEPRFQSTTPKVPTLDFDGIIVGGG
jgi:hypothetical protein